jgi:hypothetical protein
MYGFGLALKMTFFPTRTPGFFNDSRTTGESWEIVTYGVRLSSAADRHTMTDRDFSARIVLWQMIYSLIHWEKMTFFEFHHPSIMILVTASSIPVLRETVFTL